MLDALSRPIHLPQTRLGIGQSDAAPNRCGRAEAGAGIAHAHPKRPVVGPRFDADRPGRTATREAMDDGVFNKGLKDHRRHFGVQHVFGHALTNAQPIPKRESLDFKVNLEELQLVGFNADKKTVVTGVEMFRKLLDTGEAGDNVGLLLRGIDKKDIERGMVLAKPGSIPPHTKFEAEVYVLTKEEGGRHTPFFKGYRPQFYFRTTDVTGNVELPAGTEMVMPGDNIQMTIELITPIAMEESLRFAIREGGRTVGAGVVTKILK